MTTSNKPGDEPAFKEITIVPDYRALEILAGAAVELKDFLKEDPADSNSSSNSSSTSILKSIYYGYEHKKFLKQLTAVQQYLSKKCAQVPTLNSETATLIAGDLKKNYGLSKEEIVMILNQLPLTDELLDMMFPGKFSKESLQAVIGMLNDHLGIVPEMETEDEVPSSNQNQPEFSSSSIQADVQIKEEL